jgi:carbonic anhydrase/acetyltransferase-like protein (isoleucine patch superfamily)
MLYALGDRAPLIRGQYFVAPGCQIVGSVDIGNNVNIWFNTVIRADNDWVRLGDNTNIQDGSVLHVDPGKPISIGKNVTVGHKVILHGCTIADECLIGMNSVILNGARIGKHCLIGANTLIPENMEIPEGSLVLGSPGRVIKQVTHDQRAMFLKGAEHYVANAARFKEQLSPFQG